MDYYLSVKVIGAKFLKSVAAPQKSAQDLPEVCFVGRSNVGKSSMINSLAMRKIARTSSTPGATRLINLFNIEVERQGVRQQMIFSDFPGFGYAKISKAMHKDWQKMIEGYIEQNAAIKMIIWVYDVRRDFDSLDDMLVEWFIDRRLPFALVFTKTDKESRNFVANKKRLFRQAIGDDILTFSAKTGEGREELLSRILQVIE